MGSKVSRMTIEGAVMELDAYIKSSLDTKDAKDYQSTSYAGNIVNKIKTNNNKHT